MRYVGSRAVSDVPALWLAKREETAACQWMLHSIGGIISISIARILGKALCRSISYTPKPRPKPRPKPSLYVYNRALDD